MDLHPDIRTKTLRFGREQAPLMVIDNVIRDPDALVTAATGLEFQEVPRAYPGIRAAAPRAYARLLTSALAQRLIRFFELDTPRLALSLCHFSLVTRRPEELAPVQRLPHVDTVRSDGLATVHYLFRRDLGGTAFYRHRSTGFESIDPSRQAAYVNALQAEFGGTPGPDGGYIDGDTEFFKRIESKRAVFNRMLVYRRNSLHSGSIAAGFVPDPNPASGRLSINSFIDPSG